MSNCREILVPRGGHRLMVDFETLHAYAAFLKVQAARQHYWSASRMAGADEIALQKRTCECMSCGMQFSLGEVCMHEEIDNFMHMDFSGWALQISLPGFEPPGDSFFFHPALDDTGRIPCPHCGYVAKVVDKCVAFQLFMHESSTVITREIAWCEAGTELLQANMEAGNWLYPVTWQLTFHHDTHRTVVLLVNRKGECLEAADITEQPHSWGRRLMNGWQSAAKLGDALKEAFRRFYPGEFPFTVDEMTLDRLVLLNRFQGFPRSFYDAIPFVHRSNKIAPCVEEISVALAAYENVPALYIKAGLPGAKSIRRTFFENPGLFFYIDQIKALPFHDTNILLQILCSKDAYVFLSTLREYPRVFEYLQRLVMAKGETAAWCTIKGSACMLAKAATAFLVLPASKQEHMLKGKLKKLVKIFEEIWVMNPPYNIPIVQKNAVEFAACKIGAYVFAPLKTTGEYHKAGESLENCLAGYTHQQVIGVTWGGEYVAAIEVVESEILQVDMGRNTPEGVSCELSSAIAEWAQQNGLKDVTNEYE